MTTTYRIRCARPDELPHLQAIEDRAGRLYGQVGMDPDMDGLALADLQQGLSVDALFVLTEADDVPVAFALCWLRPGAFHLRELDVDPAHARQGLGARLVAHAVAEARARALPRVTLTTFSDVPWNAPYYRRLGFAELPEAEWPDWMRTIRADEAAHDFDRWPRIAMQRPVSPA